MPGFIVALELTCSAVGGVQHWSLFIDESGDLDHDDFGLVAGLIFAEAPDPSHSAAITQALVRAVPSAPWPLHAWLIDRPAGRVWGILHEGRGGSFPHPDYKRAADALRAADDRDAIALADHALRGGHQEPARELVRRADAWLSARHPRLADAVRQRLTVEATEIRGVLAQVFADHYGPSEAFVVAAAGDSLATGEDLHGASYGTGPHSLRPDRYLVLLEGLFERTFQLLGRDPHTTHEVHVQIATRGVGRLSVPGFSNLDRRDATEVVTRAATHPPGKWAGASVRLVVERASSLRGADAHGCLVLADYVANRIRRQLLQGNWKSVRRRCVDQVAVAVEREANALTGRDSVPTLASAGTPRKRLQQGFAGEDVSLSSGGRWSVQQAALWLKAMRGAAP